MGSHRESRRVRQRVIEYLQRHPGMTWAQIQESLGLSRNSMKSAMMRLKKDGDVRHEGQPRQYIYYATYAAPDAQPTEERESGVA